MSNASAFAKNWGDNFAAISIGAIALALLSAPVDANESGLSLNLVHLLDIASAIEGVDSVLGLAITVVGLGICLAVGSVLIQFGEFLALIADRVDGTRRERRRLDAVAENPILADIYRNSYAAFRLLCGSGGLISLLAFRALIEGVADPHWSTILMSVTFGIFGWIVAARFARYSFSYLDWILFAEISE